MRKTAQFVLAVCLALSAAPNHGSRAFAQTSVNRTEDFARIEAWKQAIVRHLVQRTMRARRDVIRAYDPAAGRQTFEVMLAFGATGSGHILSATVEGQSDNPTIDALALRILQNAGPLPRLPKDFAARRFWFRLPMKFYTGPGPGVGVKSGDGI